MKLTHIQTLTEEAKADNAVEELIDKTLFNGVLFHIYHWQTKSYAEHKALGDFYEALQEKVDELAELYMQGERILSPKLDFEITEYSKEAASKQLREYKEALTAAESRIMADEKSPYHAAADIMVDLQAECDKLLYLLTLE
jgi:DNA-binding ferritin-like protein